MSNYTLKSTHALNRLFQPTSVCVIGATNEPGTPGNVVMNNLISGKFLGPVMPLSTTEDTVCGVQSYREVDTLPLTPDLAVLCTEEQDTLKYIRELGMRGTQSAVVLTRGYFRTDAERREMGNEALAEAARPYGVRILGPNCLGFINPKVGLNASLAHRDGLPGKIAFVTQSDSMFTSVLDWATSKNIGFSHFISLGDRMDLHFGNILDYLNQDPGTRAILLFIETILYARWFMSAARATSRNKPVLVVKTGRSEEGALAAATHSGSYLGSDDVYDAAFRRAGMLRVHQIDSLFDTLETIARAKSPRGDRLAILTNGGSHGFLATDDLVRGGGRLAELSEDTHRFLDEELDGYWSYKNPLVIRSAAPAETYARAAKVLLQDPGVDALLVLHVPTAMVGSADVAQAVIQACRRTKKVVLTSWQGIDDAAGARDLFAEAGIPTFFTPDNAVRAFLNLVQYQRNQEMLVETPGSRPTVFQPDVDTAKSVVRRALESGRQTLTEPEAKAILAAYEIPVVPSIETSDMDGVEGVVEAAENLGYPVAVKVIAPDVQRVFQAGGMALDLESADAVRKATEGIIRRIGEFRTGARILGFSVQKMVRRAKAHNVAIEAATDPVFGPIIRFGMAGSLAELASDRSTALPPLNMALAKECIVRSPAHDFLKGYRNQPPANLDEICLAMCKVSQLLIDVPEIFELEISPVFADQRGIIALSASIHAAAADESGSEQLAIRPYPKELEECVELRDGRKVMLRPIRPEDEPAHWDFVESMSPEDRRFRFFANIGQLPRSEMIKLTQIDYDREMAFLAVGPAEADPDVACGAESEPSCGGITLGVVRAIFLPDNSEAEFAVAVRSSLKRLGLGRVLMEKIVRYCKSRDTDRITGQALLENKGMSVLAEKVGFDVKRNWDDDVFEFRMDLRPPEEDQEPELDIEALKARAEASVAAVKAARAESGDTPKTSGVPFPDPPDSENDS